MTESKIKAALDFPPERVWEVVTDLNHYAWRSDLSRIEIQDDGKSFVEYTAHGYATNFRITSFKPPNRYEFDMDNENITGHWTGIFTGTEEGVILEFREYIEVKKWIMKPFAKLYLHMQQKRYMDDLKKELERSGRT